MTRMRFHDKNGHWRRTKQRNTKDLVFLLSCRKEHQRDSVPRAQWKTKEMSHESNVTESIEDLDVFLGLYDISGKSVALSLFLHWDADMH